MQESQIESKSLDYLFNCLFFCLFKLNILSNGFSSAKVWVLDVIRGHFVTPNLKFFPSFCLVESRP